MVRKGARKAVCYLTILLFFISSFLTNISLVFATTATIQETISIYPEVDVYVHSGAPTTNYSSEVKLLVGRGRESYLRFNLEGINGTVKSAILKFYKVDSNTNTDAINYVMNDEWVENIVYNTKPAVDGGRITTFTASGKNVYVSADITSAVVYEIYGDKKLSIHVERIAGSDYANEFMSKEATDISQRPVLLITIERPINDQERVSYDAQNLISLLNGQTVLDDIYLPTIGDNGSVISWVYSSDTEKISIINNGDGTVMAKVTRPPYEEGNATVTLKANLSYNQAQTEANITLIVPKLPMISDYDRESYKKSLSDIVQLAKEYISKAQVGEGPGQFSQEAKNTFQNAISKAETVLGKTYADYKNEIQKLIQAGSDFINSVVISNRIIDEKKNTVEYSVYRRELSRLVWEAKATILVTPEYYTNSAKIALQDQIDFAEKVLNGTYQIPFVRNREFMFGKLRPDEEIQEAIEHYTMVSGFGSSTYGLKPALTWYKTQNIMLYIYKKITLEPVADTHIHNSNPTTNFGSNPTVTVGRGRTGFMRFDLRNLEGNILQAVLKTSNASSNNNTLFVHIESDDSWDENSLTYNNWPRDSNNNPILGPEIASYKAGSKDGTASVDITTYAVLESQKDGLLSISFTQDPAATWAVELYSKESADANKHPKLELIIESPDQERLTAKYNKVMGLAQELLSNVTVGSGIGQYPQSAVENLQTKMNQATSLMQSGDMSSIGRALVEVFNAMKDLRNSQILRGQIEPNTNLMFSQEDLQNLRQTIESNVILKGEYEKLLNDASSMTFEKLDAMQALLQENINWDYVNSVFKLWTGISNQNFTTPAAAKSISIKITLPSSENQQNGLGHVWIDDIRIYPSTVGGDLPIKNAGFESGLDKPDYWLPVTVSGSPIMKWEDRNNYANSGNKSIYIENPTPNDQGSWVYGEDIPVQGGIGYTLTYAVKIDGKFKDGVKIIIEYKDENGNVIGSYTSTTNRKAALGGANCNYYFQIDALAYAITKDKKYAEKAKKEMFWFMNDHLQGFETWYAYNSRPDGIDAYGAVQAGRNARVFAISYSLIKDADVFSQEEKDLLMRMVDYWMRYLTDLRDRWEMTLEEAQYGSSNWQTDMACGSALLALAFPEIPNSRQYLDNGIRLLEGQIKYNVRADGGWPESIRYHVSALRVFLPFAKILRHITGINWFVTTPLPKMLEFLVNVQTPSYKYFNDKIDTPNFGDHTMSGGVEFAELGMYEDEISQINPELGRKLLETWKKANMPMNSYSGEYVVIENFLNPLRYEKVKEIGNLLDLTSSDETKYYGLLIFRNNYGTEKESYLAIMANEKSIGHGHSDAGSFILYANKTLLVADPGIASYFDTSKTWFVNSPAHSTLQFKSGNNYLNVPSVVNSKSLYISNLLDYAKVEINHPSGASYGVHYRNIAYLKNIGAYIIWDQIKNSNDGARFNLPVVAARNPTVSGNIYDFPGYYGTDLQTIILQPSYAQITIEDGRSCAMFPPSDGVYNLKYLRIEGASGEDFLTVLYPHLDGSKGLMVEEINLDITGVKAYKIKMVDGKDIIFITNNNETAQTVSLNVYEKYLDLITNQAYDISNNVINVSVSGNSLTILRPQSMDEPKPIKLVVKGQEQVLVTKEEDVKVTYQAYLVDQYENKISNQNIKWSLDKVYNGININEDTGVLTISKTTSGISEITLIAKSGNLSSNMKVRLLLYQDATIDSGTNADTTTSISTTTTTEQSSISQTSSNSQTTSTTQSGQSTQTTPVKPSIPEGAKSISLDNNTKVVLANIEVNIPKGAITGDNAYVVVKPAEVESWLIGQNKNVVNAHEVNINGTIKGSIDVKINLDTKKVKEDEVVEVYLVDKNNNLKKANAKVDLNEGIVQTNIQEGYAKVVLATTKVSEIFKDIENSWAQKEIAKAVNLGIVSGYQDGTFRPKNNITRVETAAMIARALELKTVSKEAKFADEGNIPSWAKEAVAACNENGIIKGTTKDGEVVFNPEKEITRLELAVIAARVIKQKIENAEKGEISFRDKESIPVWAQEELSIAVKYGIIKGYTDNTFRANSPITREEAVAILSRLIQVINK